MFVTAPSRRTETTTIGPPRRRRPTLHVATPASPAVEFTWANRRPGTAGFARWTAALGRRIDEHGLTECAHDLDNLVTVAVQLAVAPIAVAILSDPTQSDPARCRAFAKVVSALASPGDAITT